MVGIGQVAAGYLRVPSSIVLLVCSAGESTRCRCLRAIREVVSLIWYREGLRSRVDVESENLRCWQACPAVYEWIDDVQVLAWVRDLGRAPPSAR
jgi:hypothetical protein